MQNIAYWLVAMRMAVFPAAFLRPHTVRTPPDIDLTVEISLSHVQRLIEGCEP